MVLFVSDMHFGRRERSVEREKEAALVECLETHADQIDHLYLVGDVFDGYIEYRHLIPKGFVRFQALLARWTDRGIPVTYLLGNHDPWHEDHFSRELGVELVPERLDVQHAGHNIHLMHGDAQASTHAAFKWVRPLIRSATALRLYRALLPADLGLSVARTVSHSLYDPAPDPKVVNALKSYAHERLQHPDTSLVVMGHSHQPALHEWAAGVYLNTGNWYEKRTFGRLDDGRLSLCEWNGGRAIDIEAAEL